MLIRSPKKHLVATLLPIIVSGFSFAQDMVTDSLRSLLKEDKNDTTQLIHLLRIADHFEQTARYADGLSYTEEAITLANRLAAAARKGSDDLRNIESHKADVLNLRGIIYYDQGNYVDAIKTHLACLRIQETHGDRAGIGNSYSNIGNIYLRQNSFADALHYYLSALDIYIERKDSTGLGSVYNNIGLVHELQGDLAEAIRNYDLSLLCAQAIKDDRAIANACFNIGNIYLVKEDLDAALKNYQVSLDLSRKTGDEASVASAFCNMGYVFMRQKKYANAYEALERAEALSKKIGQKDFLSNTYSALTELDSATGDYKSSLRHYKLFRLYLDSLNNEENTRKTVEAQMKYEFNKQSAIQQATQEKKDLIIKKDKQRQKIINSCIGIGALLLVLFCLSLIRNMRQKQRNAVLLEEKNAIIEEKQREILDSIHYARRIQNSQMATEKYIEKTLRRLNKQS